LTGGQRAILLIVTLVGLLMAFAAGALEKAQALGGEGLVFLFRDISRLFSGVTIYRYMTGTCDFGEPLALWWPGKRVVPASLGDWGWPDAVALLCCATLFGALAWRAWRVRNAEPSSQAASLCDTYLLVGFGVALLPFYWGVGHMALQPGYERYALWLVAPGTLIAARGYSALLEMAFTQSATQGARQKLQRPLQRPSLACAVMGAGIALCVVLLCSFFRQYFQTFELRGGRAHFAFRTAREEPKLVALRDVLAWQKENISASADKRLWIATADWWNYQPLRYLTMHNPAVHIVPQDRISLNMERFRRQSQPGGKSRGRFGAAGFGVAGFGVAEYEAALRSGKVWFVGFAHSPATVLFLRRLRERGLRYETRVRKDNGGKPLMLIAHILPM
jgi:hypothetical protein